MTLFSLLFPAEAARLARAERLLGRLADLADLDEWSDPQLAAAAVEATAGNEIKAAELYSKATGSGAGEARLAVKDFRSRSSNS